MDELINKTRLFVQQQLKNAEGGHDWWHIERVYNSALEIAEQENVNRTVVQLAALLHDIADSKFHDGNEELGPQLAQEFLNNNGLDEVTIIHVIQIIKHVSFKGGNFTQEFESPELHVVRDADRLDAMGAIGIARTFNYGGFRNREIYNPDIKPNLQMTKEEYKKSTAPTINHFYEKLLLLKDRMHTKTGKELANKRHEYMLNYLEQFYAEWNGER